MEILPSPQSIHNWSKMYLVEMWGIKQLLQLYHQISASPEYICFIFICCDGDVLLSSLCCTEIWSLFYLGLSFPWSLSLLAHQQFKNLSFSSQDYSVMCKVFVCQRMDLVKKSCVLLWSLKLSLSDCQPVTSSYTLTEALKRWEQFFDAVCVGAEALICT